MELILINIIPFALALVASFAPLRPVLRKDGMAWGTAAAFAVMFLWFASQLPEVTEHGPITHIVEWVPSIGLTLSWYLDSLSLLFALVVTGVGVCVFLYAGYYMETADELGRFYMYLATFAGAMLALVLAGNVFMLFIAWEGTSVMSFLLIGFKNDKSEESRIAASRALVVTGGGGLALIVGLVLLGAAVNMTNGLPAFSADGFNLSAILETDLSDHPWYTGMTLLIMLGAFTKSAQWPFHFWLPGAMTAPSPASAYLHSATMVKAGVYILFRLYPTLHHSWLWTNGLLFIGLMTMFWGALFALRQRDLKGLLAYSTVSKLGVIIALIGLPESHGLKAAAVSILAHAMYKATFFLLAGAIEHATGTRSLDKLGGLWQHMPFAGIIAALVGLSMAGFPPFIGFASKDLLLEELLPYHGVGWLPVAVAFAASILTVAAAALFVYGVFFDKSKQDYHHFHKNPTPMLFGPALLAIGSLIGGVLIAPLFDSIVSGILGKETELHIIPPVLNPFENSAFALSLLVLIGGPILFSIRHIWLTMPWFNIPSGQQLYAGFIAFWESLAERLLYIQNGKVRHYLIVILGTVAILMLIPGYGQIQPLEVDIAEPSDLLKLLLLVLTIGASIASIVQKRHLMAALSLGISGYAIGGIFLLEPAPDVALVQFLVETMATVLIILMIGRISFKKREDAIANLWRSSPAGTSFSLLRDATISIVIGVSVALFALAAVQGRTDLVKQSDSTELVGVAPITRPLALWHMENAYPEVGVTDVVASILADFRGTDTIIEITVFATAALGLLTLLTTPQGGELLRGQAVEQVMHDATSADDDAILAVNAPQTTVKDPHAIEEFSEKYNISQMHTPLTDIVSRLVMPFALMLSLTHIFYGGEAPGDGFTAGVVSGLAVALWFVVYGYVEARKRLYWLRPGRLIVVGLVVSIVNAFAGIVVSDGFLSVRQLDVDLPANLHFSTSSIFEFAIYLTIFGGVSSIIMAITHPEREEKEAPANE
jgi:NADH:ubiquinone oxidoreductase subunit 5 (subunit L)/multisubunit Na+/H+ antiporter MnhA subunit/uncharacterized MnhB-related membrane protein